MEMTEIFRINTDGSVTVFQASPEQYQKAIKLLIDWKNEEIERLREALQKIAGMNEYGSYQYIVANAALQQKDSE